MGLIKAKSKNKNFFFRRIGTEMSHIITTVHDEIDYISERAILAPLTKKLSTYLDISPYYAKYKVPFIRYTYDIEFDQWGAWTASSSFNVYEEPLNEQEHEAIDEYRSAVKELKAHIAEHGVKEEVEETESPLIILLKLAEDSEITPEQLVSKLELIKPGSVRLKVKIEGSKKKSLSFYKKLDYRGLVELLEELKLDFE